MSQKEDYAPVWQKIDREIEEIKSKLIGFIVPDGTTYKEMRALAKKAGVSFETIRNNVKRQSFSGDTLLRLLRAKGVAKDWLSYPQQTENFKISKGEVDWIEAGRELDDVEKREYASLVRYLKSRFDVSL